VNRNAERLARLAEPGQRRSWVFDYRPGEVLRDDAGDMYEIVAADPRHDRAISVQKMVLDGAGRPLPGLREGKPFFAVAERDGVRLGRGRWARRIPEVA
jgi:hypothetical protein